MNNPATIYPSSGCETALSSNWFEYHADYLFNFAIGQIHHLDVAEDLVQETCLAALKSRIGFSDRSPERTWLVGILRRKICAHLRKVCRERAVRVDPLPANGGESWEETVPCLYDVAAETQLPSGRMNLAELCASLEVALGTLPPRIAKVFGLRKGRGTFHPRSMCGDENIPEPTWGDAASRPQTIADQLGDWLQPTDAPKTSIQMRR
ncbi:MAG: RNA polymerase sigma factor [Luteolibacter sp.]